MEKYKEIERSIIKKYRKEIWSRFTKAVKDYELINENDKIMVCISGGKDSFLLAKCIQELERHGKVKFEAHYVVMDPGYNDYNRQYIIDNAKLLNIPIEIFNTDIIKENIILSIRPVEFLSHEEEICSLIKEGYSFGLTINKYEDYIMIKDRNTDYFTNLFLNGELKELVDNNNYIVI